ncbi:MAG: hypothetical protein EBR09_11155 [Proteobacteria bacterium]|nr:hypothetical protein [Pseudomonadota bacterium]
MRLFFKICLPVAGILFSAAVRPTVAHADPAAELRAESYELDVKSGKGDEPPAVTALWATGKHQGLPFRVQVPERFIEVGKLTVNYRWASGTSWAGLSEKAELHWRKRGESWQVITLGHGFRDPSSGQLLLFPAHLAIGEQHLGTLEFKFIHRLQNGDIRQDGGDRGPLSLLVVPRPAGNRISFGADWKTYQTGTLYSGEVLEIFYDCRRLLQQMNLRRDEPTPWSIVAHVRFDDRPVEEYPLVASVGGSSTQVLTFVPAVAVPESARQMSVWFLAFHNSRSYFDSNFGLNFNFDLLSYYAIPDLRLGRDAPQ